MIKLATMALALGSLLAAAEAAAEKDLDPPDVKTAVFTDVGGVWRARNG